MKMKEDTNKIKGNILAHDHMVIANNIEELSNCHMVTESNN